jgi:hypothetical protein
MKIAMKILQKALSLFESLTVVLPGTRLAHARANQATGSKATIDAARSLGFTDD